MKLGVISDTHAYFDPVLNDLLDGVDAILHAGDVGSREVLKGLGEIARVHAVRAASRTEETVMNRAHAFASALALALAMSPAGQAVAADPSPIVSHSRQATNR